MHVHVLNLNQEHMMILLNRKLKTDSELEAVRSDEGDAIFTEGSSVRCVGTDNQENDPARR